MNLETRYQIHRSSLSTKRLSFKVYLKQVIDKDDFQILRFRINNSKRKGKTPFTEFKHHDLLLMTKGFKEDQLKNQSSVALVDLISESELDLKIRLLPESNKYSVFYDLLYTNCEFIVFKICELAVREREFLALDQLRNSALMKCIVSPKKFMKETQTLLTGKRFFTIPKALFQKLEKSYNPSQFKAIKTSLKKEGVTLIHGPPGTGKTQTILGILSALLSSHPRKQTRPVLRQTERDMLLQLNQTRVCLLTVSCKKLRITLIFLNIVIKN